MNLQSTFGIASKVDCQPAKLMARCGASRKHLFV